LVVSFHGRTMTQSHHIATLVPLAVGVATTISTIMIHALPVRATITLVRREKREGHIGANTWFDMGIIARVVLYAFVAHLIEMVLWGVLFILCGEFPDFGTAFYHSAVNYTSLGYGDVIMTPSWRLLGPLETANGMLLFGVSTAMIFAVIQGLAQARFVDLKE
jgi:Ion channel